jgi:hypothetical protein
MSEPSRGGERQYRRELIVETAKAKREHFEKTGNGRMTQEQAEKSVRENYVNDQRRQGQE